MFYRCPWSGLTNLGLFFGVSHFHRFSWSERIIGINLAFRLDEDAVLLFGKCNKVPFLEIEGCKHLFGDDDLASLAHASDPLLSWGCLGCHAFRVSDTQKLSR